MRTMTVSFTEEVYDKIKRMIPSNQINEFFAIATTKAIDASIAKNSRKAQKEAVQALSIEELAKNDELNQESKWDNI